MAEISHPFQIAQPWLRPVRRATATMAVVGALIVAVWLGREPLLRGATDLWIVSDPVTRADAVAIFSEGSASIAADLYRKGLANKILVSRLLAQPPETIGAEESHIEFNRNILLKLGVPDSAIEPFGTASENIADEAVALREWTERNAVSALVIPAEVLATRRVRWILQRSFAGKDVLIEVPAFEWPRSNHAEWWKTERGVVDFQNELVKYFYYRVKYGAGK